MLVLGGNIRVVRHPPLRLRFFLGRQESSESSQLHFRNGEEIMKKGKQLDAKRKQSTKQATKEWQQGIQQQQLDKKWCAKTPQEFQKQRQDKKHQVKNEL